MKPKQFSIDGYYFKQKKINICKVVFSDGIKTKFYVTQKKYFMYHKKILDKLILPMF